MSPKRRSPIRHTVHPIDPRYQVPQYNRGDGERSYWRGKSVVDHPQGILDIGKSLDKLDDEQLNDFQQDVKDNLLKIQTLGNDIYWRYRSGEPQAVANYRMAKQMETDYIRLKDKIEVEKLKRSSRFVKVENHTYRADVGHYGGTYIDVPPESMGSFKALFPKGTFPKNVTTAQRGGRDFFVVKFADRSKGQELLDKLNGTKIKLIYPPLDD